jgi:hypothetical protein
LYKVSCIGESGIVVESFGELFTVEEDLIEQCLNTTATLPPTTAGPTTTEGPTTPTEIPESTTTGEEEPKPTEASAPSTIIAYSYTVALLVLSAASTSLLV